ncbi:MAG TPA: flagellar biosynthetic protein FliR [Pseudacidobacterium sp.]|jgi:flagellar biosynthetic protein FliR|nr:flagellar biosynthetic protein FliR [Pseudacidobacterium sp.]
MEELFARGNTDWAHYLSALVLVLVRLGGMVVAAPFFSSQALPKQVKAIFVIATGVLLAPAVAALPMAHAGLGISAVLGELSIGLVFGFSLTLMDEILLFAGQVLGVQFSFSLANLLDPNSQVETPLMSQMFSLMGVLVLIAAGLDRTILAALMRSYVAAPLGGAFLNGEGALVLVRMMGGVFFAALQLAAPVLAATMLVEIAVALIGKMSPQLPVMAVTVPAKTITGYVLLLGSLALWPRFIEARFTKLLDVAEGLLRQGVTHG